MNSVQCEFFKELSRLCYKYNIESIIIKDNQISIQSNDYLLQFKEFNRKDEELIFNGITTYDGSYSIDINTIK